MFKGKVDLTGLGKSILKDGKIKDNMRFWKAIHRHGPSIIWIHQNQKGMHWIPVKTVDDFEISVIEAMVEKLDLELTKTTDSKGEGLKDLVIGVNIPVIRATSHNVIRSRGDGGSFLPSSAFYQKY